MESNENKNTERSQQVAFLAREAERGLEYVSTYDEFILWFALPRHEKISMGLETQKAFAADQHLSERTLNRWKDRPDFLPRIKALRDKWAKERGSDVVAAIYRSAINTKSPAAPAAQKLWMQIFEGFSEKSQVEHTTNAELTVNDIRFVIEQLPEPLKSKHYANLRELLDDAAAFERARDAQDSRGSDGSAEAILREADHPAPQLPGKSSDEMAKGDQSGVRSDMVGQTPAHNHESAPRRGQEPDAGYSGV